MSLLAATSAGDIDAVAERLKSGADVDDRDDARNTPLVRHMACVRLRDRLVGCCRSSRAKQAGLTL
jgi:ankyrin repeat protein